MASDSKTRRKCQGRSNVVMITDRSASIPRPLSCQGFRDGGKKVIPLKATPHDGPRLLKMHLELIPKSLPLPLGEGWGEGKRPSESIENTGSDSSHPHPPPLSRRTGEGRLWDRHLSPFSTRYYDECCAFRTTDVHLVPTLSGKVGHFCDQTQIPNIGVAR